MQVVPKFTREQFTENLPASVAEELIVPAMLPPSVTEDRKPPKRTEDCDISGTNLLPLVYKFPMTSQKLSFLPAGVFQLLAARLCYIPHWSLYKPMKHDFVMFEEGEEREKLISIYTKQHMIELSIHQVSRTAATNAWEIQEQVTTSLKEILEQYHNGLEVVITADPCEAGNEEFKHLQACLAPVFTDDKEAKIAKFARCRNPDHRGENSKEMDCSHYRNWFNLRDTEKDSYNSSLNPVHREPGTC